MKCNTCKIKEEHIHLHHVRSNRVFSDRMACFFCFEEWREEMAEEECRLNRAYIPPALIIDIQC